MRVECVNLVDPSQHHCVSVFISARRCRLVQCGVFVIINVLFFFPPPAQQVPMSTGGKGEGWGNEWGDTFRKTDACLQNSVDQIRRENILLYTNNFSRFESCQVVDDGGSTRIICRVRIIWYRAEQSRVACNRSKRSDHQSARADTICYRPRVFVIPFDIYTILFKQHFSSVTSLLTPFTNAVHYSIICSNRLCYGTPTVRAKQ